MYDYADPSTGTDRNAVEPLLARTRAQSSPIRPSHSCQKSLGLDIELVVLLEDVVPADVRQHDAAPLRIGRLPHGSTVLRTHRSLSKRNTIGPGRFTAILRHQLEIDEDDFWQTLATRKLAR